MGLNQNARPRQIVKLLFGMGGSCNWAIPTGSTLLQDVKIRSPGTSLYVLARGYLHTSTVSLKH